jgi:AraC-like DNA-binding protein
MPQRSGHAPDRPRVPYNPFLTTVFETLRVAASFYDFKWWHHVYGSADLLTFEQQHGLEHDRHIYNSQNISQVRQNGEPVLGTHAGFCDWFVPVTVGGKLRGILATGPFATTRPASATILERWRRLTGRQGHPSDPEFAYYVSINLSTLVLDDTEVRIFQRLLTCIAATIANDGRAEAALAEAAPLRERLEQTRFVERAWDAARSMIDQRTSRAWSSRHRGDEAARLGLPRPAEQVLVGLVLAKRTEEDAIDDVLRRDRFQRACVDLARKTKEALAGQLGDHGVVFLTAFEGSIASRRARLRDLGEKATACARRFGLDLHLGLGPLRTSSPLSEHYQLALGAAEMALSRGVRWVEEAPRGAPSHQGLESIRSELAELAQQAPEALPARFERYVETVAHQCGYRLEPVRIHLEVGFERILHRALSSRAIGRKYLADVQKALDRATSEARTVGELLVAYRRAAVDVSDALQRPIPAHRDRSLRRAVAHVHEHYTEDLTLAAAAKVAGFAPNYFSSLFKEREGMTFARYLRQLRLERAHQLLSTTDLGLEQVARLSGFGVANYMARVFRSAVGSSPRLVRRTLR